MDTKKIAKFIKDRRKEIGLTQEELASKLFVTEKAISRWETERGTPDISLLLPLSKELGVTVSELLNGQESSSVDEVIEYININRKEKINVYFKISTILYVLSIFIFLVYLKFEYNRIISINYFTRLLLVSISIILIFIGNYIISNKYIDKLENKTKLKKISLTISCIYYSIFLFNITFFARSTFVDAVNLVPFREISEILRSGNSYQIIINILGNLFVFMPIEFFMIELFSIRKWYKNLLISIAIILGIEIVQYVFNVGVFDIDDIILCSFSMMLFYLFYQNIKRRIYEKRK